jgi:ribosomal protein S16
VLTLNVRFGVEMFPTEKDPIAMLASSMSPYYEPAVLEAYQHIIFDMPPGVPLHENFSGEWFGKAVRAIGTYGPTALRAVATLVPDPRVKALAAGGAALIEGVNKMSASAKEKTETKKAIVRAEETAMRAAARPAAQRRHRAGGLSKATIRR